MSKSGKRVGPAKSPTGLSEKQTEEHINEAKVQCKNVMKNYSPKTHRQNEAVKTSLSRLHQIYHAFKPLPPETAVKCRRELGLFFVESGLVSILCEIAMDYLNSGCLDADGKQDVGVFSAMQDALLVLVNYSDSTAEISDVEAQVAGFLESVGEQLKKLHVKLSTGKPATLV